MKHSHPLAETYIQNLKTDKDSVVVPASDQYFLGRLDLSEGVDDRLFEKETGLKLKAMSLFPAMFSRKFDNEDLLPKLRKPVLIIHGAKDAVVKPEIVNQHKAGIKHAQVDLMANAGHAPFWDDPAGFNRRLREFREST